MNDITIFTPAYNRAHTLRRCYESILSQNIPSLRWIVVDDGSVDSTSEVVGGLIEEGLLEINYIYQENAGKQACWNRAVLMCKTKYFLCLDSDDALCPNSLSLIFGKYGKLLNEEDVAGFRSPAVRGGDGGLHADLVSDSAEKLDWFDEFSKPENFGERIDVLKLDVLRKFLFPIVTGIKFIPEVWLYASMAEKGYKFIYTPEPVRIFYDEETYNRLSKSSVKKHAKGHFISRAKMLQCIPVRVWVENPKAYAATIIRFGQVSSVLKKNFYERRQACGGIITACLSYLAIFMPLNDGGGTEAA